MAPARAEKGTRTAPKAAYFQNLRDKADVIRNAPDQRLAQSTRRTCAQVGTLLASHARCRPFAGVFIDRYSLITMALPIPRSALIRLSREPSSPHFETRPDQTCDLVSAVPSDNLILSSLQALAKQSRIVPPRESGLLRRVAPRNDVALSPPSFRARRFASPRNNQRLDGCCALQNLPNQKRRSFRSAFRISRGYPSRRPARSNHCE